MVAITGQVPTNLLGTDAFQESDVVGVTQPVCKHNYLVTDVNELPQILKEAFYIAREGRPGAGSDRYLQRCAERHRHVPL